MEYVKGSYQAATSPSAKRSYLGIILFAAASIALLCVAALAYPVFYYNYVPKKVISIPIHLQYSLSQNPYGVTSISPDLMLEQAYDVHVELTLPRSPANLERGNFMVSLYVMTSPTPNPAMIFMIPDAHPYDGLSPSTVLFASRRPALIPYEDPLVSKASRLFFLWYHVLFPWPAPQTISLKIPMGELVEFKDVLPLTLLVDVQAGQALQVYSSTVTLVARLTGIRWFMYNYGVLAFWVCTGAFWVAEMVSMGLAWVFFAFVLSGRMQGGGDMKSEWEGQEQSLGRTSLTPPTPLDDVKFEREDEDEDEDKERMIKEENLTDQETVVDRFPRHLGDADDEGEGRGSSGFTRGDGSSGSVRRRSSRGKEV